MSEYSRRDFLLTTGSCAAHLALAGSLMPAALRRGWARSPLGSTVAREPFGSLERTPEGDGHKPGHQADERRARHQPPTALLAPHE